MLASTGLSAIFTTDKPVFGAAWTSEIEFSMEHIFKELWGRRELVWMLSARNLKIRYKHSVLGFLWSLLTPGLLILIYAIFARILRFSADRPGYLSFLVTGIVAWQFTATCLNDGLQAVTGNVNLVKKTSFPRLILPLSMTMANAVNFLLTMVVLLGYLLIASGTWGSAAWLLPAFAGHLALCLGIVFVMSTGNVFFRDMQHVVGIFSLAWFFLTPVFYEITMQTAFLPEAWAHLCYLNPMSGILGAYRSALLGDPVPPLEGMALSLTASALFLLFGYVLYQRTERLFGEVL